MSVPALAQKVRPKAREAAQPQPAPALKLQYTISFPQPHTHLYEVSLSIGNVAAKQLEVAMPTWTPGSYLQREYARNVQDFAAKDETGSAIRWEKTGKNNWLIYTGDADGSLRTITVSYRVYANELSVRTSHLDASHAYFNGASVFMFVRGALDQPYRLKVNAPAGWQVTTPLALAPDADGYYTAPNYDILVDSPAEVGTHKLLEFDARGKRHRIAIWGEGNYDEARLKEDVARIVEQGAQLFGGLPYEHYTFILHLQPNIGGGLEHLNSTTCEAAPDSFKPRRNYVRFLGLISHEYFHLWNVKRIRPKALGPFDYEHENYTRALWLSEGVTDYYGSLQLRRAGLITPEEYLEGLAQEIAGYEQTPGRQEQSAEEASFDAWIKFYRPDENAVNSQMSYYSKGSLLGFMLDLEIRSRTSGAKSLDDVMRYLYENYALRGTGFPEGELKGAFEKVAGADLTDFFNRYVSGTEEVDFNRYFQMAGLQLNKGWLPSPYLEQGEKPGWLGFRIRPNGDRAVVREVLAGSPAYGGGVNASDEVVAINGLRIDADNFDNRMAMLRAGERVALTVFRRDRMMTLDLTAAPKPPDLYRVTRMKEVNAQQRAIYEAWLRQELKQG
ncbi:MAG TPA: PDZ domain-containing protein [Blastocatellia bacterium]|nr:PDZ domain-containing protein [Blastocatellia bacterium]